ncbi:MAG: histidine kinase [Thermoanaerobacter thermocopriae]|nr:MAG: histidine kinase [Thermoanaerobacter thermocopriae]
MGEVKLRDVIDVKKAEEILQNFSDVTGLGAIIATPDGESITKPSNFTEHCLLVRDTLHGKKGCFRSDAELGRLSLQKGGVAISLCHCEIIDLAAPLLVDGKCWGYVLCGQVFLSPPTEEMVKRAIDRAKNFGIAPEVYLEKFLKIKVVPQDYIIVAGNMLQIIASYLIELGLNKLMQEKLLEETKRRSEYENIIKTLELKTLQSQVNPHFLFNTLNTAARLAYLENAPRTAEIIYSLASLLRYSLRNLDQLVALKEEISYLKHYLHIQEIRYKDHIKSQIDVPTEIENVLLPVMSLQPIVENAIIHGLEEKEEGGVINIKAYQKDETIFIEVKDNGVGIDKKMLEVIKNDIEKGKGHTTALGLQNVDRRIKMYFGKEYGLEIRSEKGNGTLVVLKIPIIKKEVGKYNEIQSNDL